MKSHICVLQPKARPQVSGRVTWLYILSHSTTTFVSTNSSFTDRALNSKAKVVTYIVNPPCTKCIIKTIHIYQREIAKISKDLPYIVVISTKEREKFLEVLDSVHLRNPVLLYDSNVFSIEKHQPSIELFYLIEKIK